MYEYCNFVIFNFTVAAENSSTWKTAGPCKCLALGEDFHVRHWRTVASRTVLAPDRIKCRIILATHVASKVNVAWLDEILLTCRFGKVHIMFMVSFSDTFLFSWSWKEKETFHCTFSRVPSGWQSVAVGVLQQFACASCKYSLNHTHYISTASLRILLIWLSWGNNNPHFP